MSVTPSKIQIAKYDNGKSRGYAFVEFSTENDLKIALDAGKGSICDRTFSIERSTRPITSKKEDKERNKDHLRNKLP